MRTWRLHRPEEGWLTLALVVFIGLVLAWSLDDPAYVNGKEELTDPLVWCALLGVAAGFAGPKLGWGRWTTHLVGAVFAGLLIPILAGWAAVPGSSIGEAFGSTAAGSVRAYLDIAWRGLPFTNQEIHYVLVLGAITWATTQFASYAVFGHRRPLNAVVMVGIVLLVNMALTTDQLPYLVALAGASLFLLIEMHAYDERATWIRRRIGDPATISSLYLRGGTVFIVVALVGSLVLTTRAASSPLAGAWEGVGDQLVELGEDLAGFLPEGGDLRPFGGVTFGATASIKDTWISDPGVAFTATIPTGEENLYWRAATYDTFALDRWGRTATSSVRVEAGQPILAGTPEEPIQAQTRPISVTVNPQEFRDRIMLVPGAAVKADRASDVLRSGTEGWFAAAELPGPRAPYTVDARVLELGEADGQVTGNELEAASTDYPLEIELLYTGVPEGALGNDARELLATILQEAGTTNPYRLAVFMQDYLQSNRFNYSQDISTIDCTAASKVECFARNKTGSCLHYASTMAMLLREANRDNPIPTRLVQGFLPAKPLGNTVTVQLLAAHAWVEVYFQGYGWIPFDPTGGGVGRPTVIPDGPAVASPTPRPSGSFGPDVPDPTRRGDGDTGGGVVPPPSGGPGDRGLLILLTVLLAVLIVTIAIAAWLRGPRGEVTPDTAWRTMSKSASRFGFGPRPNQTVYEYAAALGDLVPVAQADLQTVAEAKVETTYANLRLGGARLDEVRHATRRLRISLLRLLLRRPRRARRR